MFLKVLGLIFDLLGAFGLGVGTLRGLAKIYAQLCELYGNKIDSSLDKSALEIIRIDSVEKLRKNIESTGKWTIINLFLIIIGFLLQIFGNIFY